MSKNVTALSLSLIFAIIGAIAVVLRLARTEHPPVAPEVPRIEDLR